MASTRFIAVTLLVIFILQTFLLQTESATCCLSYAKSIPKCHRMKGYTLQTDTGICDMDAIIFHTKRGASICANLSNGQTKMIIECLNERHKGLP